jgi:iron complex transport system ATP-binding protein
MTRVPSISCAGVTLQVGRGQPRVLVAGLDWAVEAGQRWAVLGPNGAGKSSLLSALAGVRRPDAGTIAYDAAPLGTLGIGVQAAHRALVADRWFDPFAASVGQTVLTGRYRFGVDEPEARAFARELLARLDCAALADADVRDLSRGERQRVAIATALAQDTPLLLLDEPIAHQDPRHQALVLEVLRESRARAVIASLHDVNAALRFATHALLLTGRGTWFAGPAETMLTAARMSDLFGTAFLALNAPAPQGGARLLVAQSAGARNSPPL